MLENILIPAIVFFSIYQILSSFSVHLLKRKIIKTGHIERAGILESHTQGNDSRYPALKWGLVALMGGIGFIVIEVIRYFNPDMINNYYATIPVGILLVALAIGFLAYFFIVRKQSFNNPG